MLHKSIVQLNLTYVRDKVFIVIQQFVFIHPMLMDILICKLDSFLFLSLKKKTFYGDFILFSLYNNGWRDVNSLRAWAFQYLPSKVTEVDGKNFSTNILRDSKPWLIDFYGMIIINSKNKQYLNILLIYFLQLHGVDIVIILHQYSKVLHL